MADTHETIADIAAEKRRIAKEVRDHASNGDYWDKKRANETAEDLEEEADRLEAAHKRESGDRAKLREFARLVSHMNDDGYWNRSASICSLVGKAEAALAAPPRNCDRFASAEEAWDAYDKWVESYRAKGEVPPFNEFGWLFAPATEKEGENDGRK